MGPDVEALQALRGDSLVAAAGVIAELGNMPRFDNPRQFMAFIGLVPGEHLSGIKRKLTGITKAATDRRSGLGLSSARDDWSGENAATAVDCGRDP
ncbi:transposase [Methylocystis rosea]|uniref:transposase n=1 Tax=Methylocystis rosea TaxID=173366 RepID=UPI0013DE597F|nr:transposase [Methylocystis rosea]